MRRGVKFNATAVPKRGRRVISVIIGLTLLLRAPALTYAQTTPSPSPSASPSLSVDDFEAVCGPVLSRPAPTHEADLAVYNQQLPICQGAAASHEAMKDQDLLWKIWAGVGVVCAAACGASFFGAGNQYICMGANVAAGVTEGVVTEDFMAAMSGVMGAGASFLVNSMTSGGLAGGGNSAANNTAEGTASGSNGGSTGGSSGANNNNATSTNSSSSNSTSSGQTSGSSRSRQGNNEDRDIGACISAGMAVFQAVGKHSSARSAEETLSAAMAELSRLQSTAASAPLPGSIQFSTAETSTQAATPTTTTTSHEETAVAEPKPDATKSCSGTVSSTGESIACATGLDGNLPGFVKNPKFAKEFERGARQGLDDFLGGARSGSAGSDIAGAMGGVLTQSAQGALKAAADQLAESLGASDPNIASTAYRGGGARRAGGSGGGDDDFMGQMAGLMGKLLPGGKGSAGAKDQSTQAIQAVMQSGKTQPGRIEEDRGLSLFDRVKVRYLSLTQAQRVGGEDEARKPAQD